MYSIENRILDTSSMILKNIGDESWIHLMESMHTPTVETMIRVKIEILTIKLVVTKICNDCFG